MLYIIGGAGIAVSVIAIVLMLIFHSKDKSKVIPIILYTVGLILFLGSGFLYSRGVEIKLPEKEKTDEVQKPDNQESESQKEDEPSSKNDSPVSDPKPTEPEPDVPAEPDPAPVLPQSGSSGSLGNYYVEIKDAFIAKDYDGNPAIVVTYSWTNNNEETTSAMLTLIETAYQDGIELEGAIVTGDDRYNSDDRSKKIRPGVSLDVQRAFCLRDESSTVEFEVSEFISFSNDVVAKNFNPADLG